MKRRARRAKTDKLDLAGPLNLLARYLAGDRRGWRVVRVPRATDEDARQLHRSWETVQKDRTRLRCRLQGLLTTQGVRLRITDDFLAQLETMRLWEGPTFSPDGRWLAYTSDEAGRLEIFVQPYPGAGGKWQVSTDGGTEPVLNRNGRELSYRTGNKMMAVDVTTGTTFSAGKPRILFEAEYVASPATLPNYDVSADGQRFLMLTPGDQAQPPTQINVVTNWTEELKRRVLVK